MNEKIRPAILAALDGSISLGVLALSGIVSFEVACLAMFAGMVSMAVGEYVSVENGLPGYSPWQAATGSLTGFFLGSLPPTALTLTGDPRWVFGGTVVSLIILSFGIARINGISAARRAFSLGLFAFVISFLIGV